MILNKLWRVFDHQTGLLFVYSFCVCTTFFLYTAGHFCVKHVIGKDPFCRLFVNYNSPTILFAGVSLLLFFSNLKLSRLATLIRIASPLAFSVYLIHTQQQIWFKLFGGAFKWAANLPSWLLPIAILILPLPIYVLCSVIDYIRLRLFKLLKLA